MAQKRIELFSISEQFSFPSNYDSVYTGQATERTFNAQLTVPLKIKDSTIFFTNITYDNFFVKSSGLIPAGIANPIQLHGLFMRTGIVQNIRNNQSLFFLVMPRLYGDFKEMDAGSLQWGGIFLYEKSYREDYTIGFGFNINQDYAGPFFVPLVFLQRDFGKKWSIDALMPQDFNLKFELNDRLSFGFKNFNAASGYRLDESNFSRDYIFRFSTNLSLYSRVRLFGHWYSEVRFGYVLARQYTQYDKDDVVALRLPLLDIGETANRMYKNANMQDGAFIRVKLLFDFPIPED